MTIWYLVALSFFTHFGFAGSRYVVSLYAITQGATPFIVGTIAALYAFCPLFLALPAGRVADRLGFKLPLVFGTSGVCISLVMTWLWPSLGILYATATLLGISFMALQLATQTLAGAIAGPSERARNFSLVSLGFATANFMGPLTTGWMIDNLGHVNTFGMLALPLVPAIAIALMGSRWLPASTRSKVEVARGGTAELLRIKTLRDTLIASAIISGAWDVYQFFMPIYCNAQGLSATAGGVVMAAFAIAIILVRLFIPHLVRRWGESELLTYSMFILCFSFALLPFFHTLLPLLACSFILGLGCGCGQPLSMTLLFNAAPKGRAGEATGLRITGNQLMHTVIPLLFGALGSAAGYPAVFFTNSACVAAGGWLSWRNGAKVRRPPKP